MALLPESCFNGRKTIIEVSTSTPERKCMPAGEATLQEVLEDTFVNKIVDVVTRSILSYNETLLFDIMGCLGNRYSSYMTFLYTIREYITAKDGLDRYKEVLGVLNYGIISKLFTMSERLNTSYFEVHFHSVVEGMVDVMIKKGFLPLKSSTISFQDSLEKYITEVLFPIVKHTRMHFPQQYDVHDIYQYLMVSSSVFVEVSEDGVVTPCSIDGETCWYQAVSDYASIPKDKSVYCRSNNLQGMDVYDERFTFPFYLVFRPKYGDVLSRFDIVSRMNDFCSMFYDKKLDVGELLKEAPSSVLDDIDEIISLITNAPIGASLEMHTSKCLHIDLLSEGIQKLQLDFTKLLDVTKNNLRSPLNKLFYGAKVEPSSSLYIKNVMSLAVRVFNVLFNIDLRLFKISNEKEIYLPSFLVPFTSKVYIRLGEIDDDGDVIRVLLGDEEMEYKTYKDPFTLNATIQVHKFNVSF